MRAFRSHFGLKSARSLPRYRILDVHHSSQTGYRPYCANFLDSCSAMAWPATAFQLILDLVKRWWLDGFAACMVNGQLAIACPLKSHTAYITAYISKSLAYHSPSRLVSDSPSRKATRMVGIGFHPNGSTTLRKNSLSPSCRAGAQN
jgi:hypothetical protein